MWLRRDWGCLRLRPAPDWPQAPAGLGFGVAGLRPCVPARAPAGHRWPQSPAGLSVAGLRLDRAGHRLASNAGRAMRVAMRSPAGSGGAAPGYLLTNCQVRGQSLQGGRARQFAAGAPRHDPALPSRRRRSAGGREKTRPSPIDLCGERERGRWSPWRGPVSVTASSHPPAVGRVRDRGVGTGRGAPAANCTHGRLKATDPAPCSL
ncbi:hypothetical protein FRZ02_31635 [Streptomyces albidoflavus]|uniref:Uncharacterized protein n=1 Tax=Streptomyces albidoflavus TaxID=1886 RepID=A0ABY3GPB6_9ACTN|nr:hypothetical protein FRZ02_31635 [Streptomyces albidoflavus]